MRPATHRGGTASHVSRSLKTVPVNPKLISSENRSRGSQFTGTVHEQEEGLEMGTALRVADIACCGRVSPTRPAPALATWHPVPSLATHGALPLSRAIRARTLL